MLSVDEVWSLIDREVCPLDAERAPLGEAFGRRLGEDILADADMPAYNRAAIDGFAVPAGSKPGQFRILNESKPGYPVFAVPGTNEAVKIFTGSALPESGVELVMVEDTTVAGEVLTTRVPSSSKHIRPRASQARAGEVLLRQGAPLNSGAVALLASVGAARPLVSSAIKTAHLVTGGELVACSDVPAEGFIRDSNSPLIASLLAEAGAALSFQRRASEDIDDAVRALDCRDADLFLISGGASVGAYDGTGEILRRLGFTIHCAKVKSRPGKPLIFGTRGRQAAFGLPGNPLSHFVCFHLFVRRAIERMKGNATPRLVEVSLAGDPPPPDPRETWWPAIVRGANGRLVAEPLPWQDSSDLTGLSMANALLRISSVSTNALVESLLFGRLAS